MLTLSAAAFAAPPIINIPHHPAIWSLAVRKQNALQTALLYDPVWKAPQGYQQRPGEETDTDYGNLIYPSPAGNTLFVRNNSGRTMALYDLGGRLIARYELTGDITQINISRLSPGVYIADIEDHGRRVYHQKIVKR